MVRRLKALVSGCGGLTLVEIIIVMTISAIVFTGMLYTYSEGIRYTRHNSSMMVLYNEGTVALDFMAKRIRLCEKARIRPYGGVSHARLDLTIPQDIRHEGGDVDFYFSKLTKTLKWDDMREGTSRFNQIFLPMLDYEGTENDEPYLKVKDLRFTPLDYHGTPSPVLEGYSMIRIDMVLEDDQGDTLYLYTISSKRNG
jgi:type II secretory pathway pseudopilin PulG